MSCRLRALFLLGFILSAPAARAEKSAAVDTTVTELGDMVVSGQAD